MSQTLMQRFWSKVHVTPQCWVWTGSRNQQGYGLLTVRRDDGGRTTRGAHRIAWELLVGPIPDGLEIDHLCKIRHCVNPAHLEVVTHQENMRRGERANQTHCKRGHPLEGDNVRLNAGGRPQRQCRTCMRAAAKAARERRDASRRVIWHRRPRRSDPYDWALECPELVWPRGWTVRIITPRLKPARSEVVPFTDFLGARDHRSRAEASCRPLYRWVDAKTPGVDAVAVPS